MRTYLVTGGAGFIGSHLCEKLLEQGNHIICLDNFFTGSRKNVEHLFDKNLKHACRNVKVGDNAVLKRAYGDNGAGGAAYDVLCFLTDIAHGVGAGVHRDHGRLAHDYALAF